MTEAEKMKLFKAMLYLEDRSGDDRVCESVRERWFYEADGAFHMLEELGISKEYINWAVGKTSEVI